MSYLSYEPAMKLFSTTLKTLRTRWAAARDVFDFDSDNGGDDESCNGKDTGGNILDDPYPATASAMLLDFRLLSGAGATATDEMISPQLPDPSPVVTTGNYQLYFTIPAAGAQDFISMQRINPIVSTLTATGNTPPRAPTSEQFTMCQINTPGVGQSVGGYIIYRGYVESIGHLTQN
jgi:hypothetical protein